MPLGLENDQAALEQCTKSTSIGILQEPDIESKQQTFILEKDTFERQQWISE